MTLRQLNTRFDAWRRLMNTFPSLPWGTLQFVGGACGAVAEWLALLAKASRQWASLDYRYYKMVLRELF